MFALAIYGWSKGDPGLLASPYDSCGNPCGRGNLTGYDYIYFVQPTSLYLFYIIKNNI